MNIAFAYHELYGHFQEINHVVPCLLTIIPRRMDLRDPVGGKDSLQDVHDNANVIPMPDHFFPVQECGFCTVVNTQT